MKEKPKPRGKQPITTVKPWQRPRGGKPNVTYRFEPPKPGDTSYQISFPPEK